MVAAIPAMQTNATRTKSQQIKCYQRNMLTLCSTCGAAAMSSEAAEEERRQRKAAQQAHKATRKPPAASKVSAGRGGGVRAMTAAKRGRNMQLPHQGAVSRGRA